MLNDRQARIVDKLREAGMPKLGELISSWFELGFTDKQIKEFLQIGIQYIDSSK